MEGGGKKKEIGAKGDEGESGINHQQEEQVKGYKKKQFLAALS